MKYTSPQNKHAYYQKVWEVVRQIPPGRVSSYGQIASFITAPEVVEATSYRAFGARWVGGAMKGCPEDVPWQRVINAQGKISLKGEAYQRQKILLESEGVVFDEHDRVNFKLYGWIGPEGK